MKKNLLGPLQRLNYLSCVFLCFLSHLLVLTETKANMNRKQKNAKESKSPGTKEKLPINKQKNLGQKVIVFPQKYRKRYADKELETLK